MESFIVCSWIQSLFVDSFFAYGLILYLYSLLMDPFFAYGLILCACIHYLLMDSFFVHGFILCSWIHSLFMDSFFFHGFILCSWIHSLFMDSFFVHAFNLVLVLVCLAMYWSFFLLLSSVCCNLRYSAFSGHINSLYSILMDSSF